MKLSIPKHNTIPFIYTTKPTPYSWINNATPGPSSGPLSGKSIAIKDNISYSKAPTSCSSSILRGNEVRKVHTELPEYHPPYDATCVSSLQQAGARITGQTKMDEFGMGSQTTHLPDHYTSVYNPAHPPGDEIPRVAGGSSGGSAAAVAEGSCWAALGTDTGGSVRLPASYCGVVGLKPSYGMISRYGVVSYADSLDCVGVLGKTIETVKSVFDTISHPDRKDMTCLSLSLRRTAKTSLQTQYPVLPIPSLRIGLLHPSTFPHPVPTLPESLITHLSSVGATFHQLKLPNLKSALPAYYVLACAEAASNLGRFGGGWFGSPSERMGGNRDGGEEGNESGEERRRRIRDGFGREVKKRILAGTYALTADAFNNSYLKALHLRSLVRDDFNKVFRVPHPLSGGELNEGGVDVILHPTAVGIAPLHPSPLPLPSIIDTSSENSTSSSHLHAMTSPSPSNDTNPAQEYIQDLLTVPASLAGLPALNVPGWKSDEGWPLGLSLVGQWGMEEALFDVGRGIEVWAKGNSN